MDRIIKIDGKDVKFRATARTPRLYRGIIGRDMIVDMNSLCKAYNEAEKARKNGEEKSLTIDNLQIFEDVAYIMARHADPTMVLTPDEWLDSFNMFSIYEILPTLLELWAINNKTTSSAKKK